MSFLSTSSSVSTSFKSSGQDVSVTKPTTIQEFLGVSMSQQQPNISAAVIAMSDPKLEGVHATSGNSLFPIQQDYFSRIETGTAARTRTSSMISRASLLPSTGPFSPCLSPLALSPLGTPFFQGAAGAQLSSSEPRSPSDVSDSDSALTDESGSCSGSSSAFSGNSNLSRDTLISPTSEVPPPRNGHNHVELEGLNPLFADIPLVQEVQEYSDTDSFTEYRARKAWKDVDDRSIYSNSTEGSYSRGPLMMTPFSSKPGTPVVEKSQFFDGQGISSGSAAPGPASAGSTLKSSKSGQSRRISMAKFGHSVIKALEAHGMKKSRV